MRGLVAVLLIASLALAGCTGKEKGEPEDSGPTASGSSTASATKASTSTSGTASSSGTGSTGPKANHAPVGSLQAAPTSGAAPLTVNFTMNGTDPDGDALQWTLAFGDGNQTTGTTLPANATHAFATMGNYSANLTISDGKTNVSYVANLTVAAGAAGGAQGLTFSGDVARDCASTCEGCDPVGEGLCAGGPNGGGCLGFNAGRQGVDCIWTEIPAALVAHPFTLTSTGGDPDLEFFDACDPIDGTSKGESLNSGPETGSIPAGAGCVILWEWNPVAGDASTLTFVIT